MDEIIAVFLSNLAIEVRYAAADAVDPVERGCLNAIASAIETAAGYRRVRGTIGVA